MSDRDTPRRPPVGRRAASAGRAKPRADRDHRRRRHDRLGQLALQRGHRRVRRRRRSACSTAPPRARPAIRRARSSVPASPPARWRRPACACAPPTTRRSGSTCRARRVGRADALDLHRRQLDPLPRRRRPRRQGELLDTAQEFGRIGLWERRIPSGEGRWDRHVFGFWGLDPAAGTPPSRRRSSASIPTTG